MPTPRRSRAEWCRLLDRQACSGLSMTAFAEREGIRPSTLSWWRWKLGVEPSSVESEPPRFVQLEVSAPSSPGFSYEIEVGEQVRLRIPSGFEEEELRGLLRALRELC